MMNKKIAILGGGNIGISIAKGLIKSGKITPSNLYITRRRSHLLKELEQQEVHTGNDNGFAVDQAEIIFIAVKPSQAQGLLKDINDRLDPGKHLLISVVTGVNAGDIREITGAGMPVFLAMPNTAISLCESMTCISSKNNAADKENLVIEIFESLGKAIIINEELMGSATVLAACGIAFALRFMRAASQGGIEIGFGSELSTLIAAQTLKGASELILTSGHHPEREIDKVTTPQGITISGLNEMEHNGFSSALIKGLLTSYTKITKVKLPPEEK
jgi:pyrroline-5-carboxylate reductase